MFRMLLCCPHAGKVCHCGIGGVCGQSSCDHDRLWETLWGFVMALMDSMFRLEFVGACDRNSALAALGDEERRQVGVWLPIWLTI